MAESIRCSVCHQIFNSYENYKNHTCQPTLGGEDDLRKIKEGSEGAGTDGDL